MVTVRIVDTPAFIIIGKKTWIKGIDDLDGFGSFYDRCRRDGTLNILAGLWDVPVNRITGSAILGVSCVEKEPAVRQFHFYVAAECRPDIILDGFEKNEIPAGRWAVFRTCGHMPGALVDAEMYAFKDWLPASGYVHAFMPEIEAYPPDGSADDGGIPVEFWLPIVAKG